MISDLDYKELLPFQTGPQIAPEVRSARFQRLIDRKYLEPAAYQIVPNTLDLIVTAYRLSVSGEDALSEYQRAQEEMCQQKADKQADRRTQIIVAVLGALLGSAATLFVEHINEIINLFH